MSNRRKTAEGKDPLSEDDATRLFIEAVSVAGLGEPDIPTFGEWHNYDLPDHDPGQKKGSAKLNYGDHIEGVIKDFRQGSKIIFTWTPIGLNGAKIDIENREKAKATKKAAQDKARELAIEQWNKMPRATIDHPYLKRKGITNAGCLTDVRQDGDALVVVMVNARTGQFQTIQRIFSDGSKSFPRDSVTKEGCSVPGGSTLSQLLEKTGKGKGPIAISEGWATGVSINTSTFGVGVIAAMSAGQLMSVAKAIRDRYPLRPIIIAADRGNCEELANEAAFAVGGKVAVPPEFKMKDGTDGKDFNDMLLTLGAEAVEEAISKASTPSRPAEYPTIQIKSGHLSDATIEAEQALLASGRQIYQRSNELVRPVIEPAPASGDRTTKIAQLLPVTATHMRYAMSRVAKFVKWNGRSKDIVQIDPPPEIAGFSLARAGEWKFPVIEGVISTPTMRPDGTILDRPGYDEATRLLLVNPPKMPPIPDKPTRKDALESLALIEGLQVEFPFVDDVSKSVGLSSLITPVVRGAFPFAPLHAATAPAAGTGKSYWFDTVAAIAIGDVMPVMSQGANADETEKRIGAVLMAAQPLISIDNVDKELFGAALCQILTQRRANIRILGKSEKMDIETGSTTIFANGNNLIIKGDLSRRTIRMAMDRQIERPYLYRYSNDPVATVLADRGKYVAAILTICRWYFVAGRPGRVTPLVGFGGWSDTVRSALIALGKDDPVKSIETGMDDDPEFNDLGELLEAWAEDRGIGHKIKLRDLISAATETRSDGAGNSVFVRERLNAALRAVGGSHGKIDSTPLGLYLRGRKGRIVGGLVLRDKSDRKHGSRWWIEAVDGRETEREL